jgi:hypothetical protein
MDDICYWIGQSKCGLVPPIDILHSEIHLLELIEWNQEAGLRLQLGRHSHSQRSICKGQRPGTYLHNRVSMGGKLRTLP